MTAVAAKNHKAVIDRCPWCRRELSVYRRQNGEWWHRGNARKKSQVEWYCPASKLRESPRQ